MPNSTRSNKETQLLFSSVPTSLERSIRKERRSSSIDNNTNLLLDSYQPPSTHTPFLSLDTHSPPSTKATLSSTDIFHPTSINISVRTSIDTEPRDMVATLILVRDDNGDLHDHEGHLRNAADDDFWQVVNHEKLQEGDFGSRDNAAIIDQDSSEESDQESSGRLDEPNAGSNESQPAGDLGGSGTTQMNQPRSHEPNNQGSTDDPIVYSTGPITRA
ncbi:hypothetical protein F2Q70_00038932 [Brassica cretica]|uniref:Uncharacterized protein n=1 Tax=Brassica cretica TaxID=69181 RepID=A0A8S9K1P3_BRACR|nr:hypothetical protein F2Q70_00038932 [Brassica cretica]